MTALVYNGMPRQEAHKLLRQLLSQSKVENMHFSETLSRNPVVARYLSREGIEAALEPRAYLGVSGQLVDAAVEKAVAERRARGLAA
jgi:adenylosuccinate lyase